MQISMKFITNGSRNNIYISIDSDNGLSPVRLSLSYGLVYWRISMSLGLDELIWQRMSDIWTTFDNSNKDNMKHAIFLEWANHSFRKTRFTNLSWIKAFQLLWDKFSSAVLNNVVWSGKLWNWFVTQETLNISCVTLKPPANIQRNKHVMITSKRRFDVMITCSLRCAFAGSDARLSAGMLIKFGPLNSKQALHVVLRGDISCANFAEFQHIITGLSVVAEKTYVGQISCCLLTTASLSSLLT